MKMRVDSAALAIVTLLAAAGSATAKDAVQAGVTIPAGQPIPVMTENGTGYTPGTYAVGTIVLHYTYVGTSFPIGQFAAFRLNLSVYDVSAKNDPSYPAAVALEDIGSPNLTLTAAPSLMDAGAPGWQGSALVSVEIPWSVASDPELNADGAELVGKLRLSAPGNPHLDTVTDVIVKIRLVHPVGPCVKAYSFITDADLTETVTTTEVNVNSRRNKVNSTNPFGSLSSNALVVNTCGYDIAFDIGLGLDPWFSTQPSNNPGNAVFSFSTGGAIDPEAFDIAAFENETTHGQNLCLQQVNVPAGTSFLAAVHTAINKDLAASDLPADGTFDEFRASFHAPASACQAPVAEAVDSNPAEAALAFTVKSN